MLYAVSRIPVLQAAVKHIAASLARAGIDELYGVAEGAAASAERDEPKQLDVLAVRAFPSSQRFLSTQLGCVLASLTHCFSLGH